jgi:hypothetical protein
MEQKVAIPHPTFSALCRLLPGGEVVTRVKAASMGYVVSVPATAQDVADAQRRGRDFAELQAFVRGEQQTQPDPAPAIDPALVAAARAIIDPDSSPFAHLNRPRIKGEAEAQVSNMLAALRVAGGTDPPAPEGTAGAILAAGEKRRAGTDATTPVPDVNSKNPSEALAARILAAGRKRRNEE